VLADVGNPQTVLVLAGSRVAFEAYLRAQWGIEPPPGRRSIEVGRFRFVQIREPEDARGYDRETPYVLLPGWSQLPLPVLKAVLDRLERRFL
jgi:hypothetical protein